MLEYHDYFMDAMVRDKQARFEELAARRAALRALRPPHRALRIRLGLSLIRAGRWMVRHHGTRWADEGRRLA